MGYNMAPNSTGFKSLASGKQHLWNCCLELKLNINLLYSVSKKGKILFLLATWYKLPNTNNSHQKCGNFFVNDSLYLDHWRVCKTHNLLDHH